LSPDGAHLAAGYQDGSIRIWQAFGKERTCVAFFQGHKKEVSTLTYNSDGSLLVSGSADTELVIWDASNESGLYRLIGHKDRITDTKFLFGNRLISSSKDALIKIWDLETQHCVQTLIGHRNEVWSFDINPEQTRLVTGSTDDKLRVWKIPQDLKNDV
jgi:U3 small nucleolar RNA-associated protein 12